MRRLFSGIALSLLASAAMAQTVTTTTHYTVNVTITPAITAVAVSTANVNGIISLTGVGSIPVGTVVGHVSVLPAAVTYTGTITLSGTSASNYSLTNNGQLPCDLVTATAITASRTGDAINLSATQ